MRVAEDVFIKNYGLRWEAYIDNGCSTFCWANGALGDGVIVDEIKTPEKFRRAGYATRLIKEVKSHFKMQIIPFAIQDTDCAREFWKSIK